jgi:NADH-quinone oxidoreductase subunit C
MSQLDQLAEKLKRDFGSAITEVKLALGELTLAVDRSRIPDLLGTLRDDPACEFKILVDLCGNDWPERAKRFDVVYHLLSLTRNMRIRIKAMLGEGEAIPSCIALYPAAGWFEREAFDMYGIAFEGNSDLRRILTDYGFSGYPLRKDFPLTGYVELRYDEERKQVVYEPVKLTQDWRTFDFISPWEGVTTLPGDEKVHEERTKVTRNPPQPPPEKS